MFMNSKTPSLKDGKSADVSEKYKIRYNQLRKYMIALVYENTALCDQVTYMQEKILHIKEENNFFSRKLKHIEFTRMTAGVELKSPDTLKKTKRKVPVHVNSETPLVPKMPVKPKQTPNKTVKKRQTLTVSEESSNRFHFPISLNDDLTVQNLGEIVTDRITYNTEDLIYPAGYVATKIYGSVRNPKSKCLYTCKIIDDGMFPRFEIISEQGLVLVGNNPDECHKKLLSLINENYSARVVNDSIACGAEFFGLTNTTVHYLILSLPGVAKCVKYNFKKFSERIASKDDILVKDDIEACTNYSALLKVLPETFNRDNYMTSTWLSR